MAAAGGAFGGNRGLQPLPPEKGVFPLDHLQECKNAMKEYMQCLKESKYSSERCRRLSKEYLTCRMERNLMVKQDLSELGFKEGDNGQTPADPLAGSSSVDESHKSEREGFISGLPTKRMGNSP